MANHSLIFSSLAGRRKNETERERKDGKVERKGERKREKVKEEERFGGVEVDRGEQRNEEER